MEKYLSACRRTQTGADRYERWRLAKEKETTALNDARKKHQNFIADTNQVKDGAVDELALNEKLIAKADKLLKK
ncbi:hypothetical protein [Pseudaminobacter sp. NGMCC 1.201702]|uniref:hypothetical protein n=1 Tax=Pseudaminobacter sp. NGMCC 1.201702 TaxID=3391825 RepID=UPI0039F0DF88